MNEPSKPPPVLHYGTGGKRGVRRSRRAMALAAGLLLFCGGMLSLPALYVGGALAAATLGAVIGLLIGFAAMFAGTVLLLWWSQR